MATNGLPVPLGVALVVSSYLLLTSGQGLERISAGLAAAVSAGTIAASVMRMLEHGPSDPGALEKGLVQSRDDLARLLTERWGLEESLRKLNDLAPLPVMWSVRSGGQSFSAQPAPGEAAIATVAPSTGNARQLARWHVAGTGAALTVAAVVLICLGTIPLFAFLSTDGSDGSSAVGRSTE